MGGIDRNGKKWLDMPGNSWQWQLFLKMALNARNGWKWLEMAGNGWK